MYSRIGAPPVEDGAVNATDAEALPVVATTFVGALGTAAGVPPLEFDAAPAPTLFTAFNFTEYDVPFVKPVITIGVSVDAGTKAVNEFPPSVET
jgi:hypothetical protein